MFITKKLIQLIKTKKFKKLHNMDITSVVRDIEVIEGVSHSSVVTKQNFTCGYYLIEPLGDNPRNGTISNSNVTADKNINANGDVQESTLISDKNIILNGSTMLTTLRAGNRLYVSGTLSDTDVIARNTHVQQGVKNSRIVCENFKSDQTIEQTKIAMQVGGGIFKIYDIGDKIAGDILGSYEYTTCNFNNIKTREQNITPASFWNIHEAFVRLKINKKTYH